MYVLAVPSTIRVLDVLPRMPARTPQPGSTVAGPTSPVEEPSTVERPSTVEAPPSPLDSLELELPQCDANRVSADRKSKKPTPDRTLTEVLQRASARAPPSSGQRVARAPIVWAQRGGPGRTSQSRCRRT